MAVLSKAAIFSAAPRTIEVQIPEWNGSVKVQAYSILGRQALVDALTTNAQDVLEYERDQALPEDERQGLTKVERLDEAIVEIIHSCVDDAGDRIFDLADHDRLKTLGYANLIAILAAIREINQVPDQATLKKNSA